MLFRFEYAAVLSIGVLFIILFGVFYVNDTLAEQVLTLALASSSSTLPMPRDIFISTMFLVGEFFVTIIALVTLPQLIVRDEQQKTLPLFLSRPIPRWNYYFGKYIASTATLSASMCFLAAFISVFVFIQSPLSFTGGGCFYFFLVFKIALLSEWAGTIIVLLYYIGGHFNFLFPKWGSAYAGTWGDMMLTAYYILPDLTPVSSWSLLSAAVENYPLDINYGYWFLKQTGIYTIGFLFLGYDSFRKKSF